MLHAGTCPQCDQGVRGFRTCGEQPLLMCDECEAVWSRPDAAAATFPAQPDLPSPLTARSLIGPSARWCSRPEVDAAGWSDAIVGEVESQEVAGGIDPLPILFGSPAAELDPVSEEYKSVADDDDRFSVLEPGGDHSKLEAVVVTGDVPYGTADIELALQSKKNVLAKLPWGDLTSTRELVSIADEEHRTLAPLLAWPRHQRTLAIRRTIDEGTIGPVRRIVIGRSESDGGDLESLVLESVLAANWAADAPPNSGSTTGLTATSAIVTLEYETAMAVLDVSDDLPRRQWVEIVGTRGSIVCDDFFNPSTDCETRFWIHDVLGNSETQTVATCDGRLETLVSLFRMARTGEHESGEAVADAAEVSLRLLNRVHDEDAS